MTARAGSRETSTSTPRSVSRSHEKGCSFKVPAAVVVAQLRVNLTERHTAARRIFSFHATGENGGRAFESRMVQQEPGQFRACVSCHPHDRCLNGLRHDSSIVLKRDSTSLALR